MIEIFPHLSISFECINCAFLKIEIKEILFQGIHVLAECKCKSCQQEFYHTLPVAHDSDNPISFSVNGQKSRYNERSRDWLALPLINSVFKHSKQFAEFDLQIRNQKDEVIIVNCIDDCFGHIFTKLWNVPGLISQYPDKGVVVLIPSQALWLVPDDAAEIWVVESDLNGFNKWISGLDEFVKQQLNRFKKVFLADTYVHLDHSQLDLSVFTKTSRFNLLEYSTRAAWITFIAREDRFWHNSHLMDFIFRAAVKIRMVHHIKGLYTWRQNQLINQAVKKILKKLPQAKFFITGLGNSGRLNRQITDLRVTRINLETEQKWNTLFSKCQIVIGVHGSNMLIPTSLSAGFINIMPRYKIARITEDTSLPYKNRYLQFLGRHLDEYSSPDLVSMHAVSMINDFPLLYKNTEQK